MLIQFSVENYRSFREEQTLSLVAGIDDTHEHNLVQCDKGLRLVKVASVYGANASGKSNLLKAMKAMRGFVLQSATKMTLGEPISFVAPFRLDATNRNEPSRFEITLLLDGATYIYGFSATRERVHEEWLHMRPSGGRFSKWLERTFDPATSETSWAFRGPLKNDTKLLREKTRDNGLVLSRAAEFNVDAVAPLFLWFQGAMLNLDLSFPPFESVQITAELIRKDESFRKLVLRFLRDADLSIIGLSVSEAPVRSLLDNFSASQELREQFTNFERIIGGEKLTRLAVSTEHTTTDGDSVPFSLEDDESNGTQRLFAVAAPVLAALASGTLLVIDELECSIHPLLTRKIIELFQSELNTKGAQLVFATHDSSVMDQTLLRRDQVWLAEKRANGATDLFSLYDFDTESRPRVDSAFEKNYLAGRYGAVPSFGPSLEGLEP